MGVTLGLGIKHFIQFHGKTVQSKLSSVQYIIIINIYVLIMFYMIVYCWGEQNPQ